jgi:hypothetical protein
MVCVGPDGKPSPSLPGARLTDIRLVLEDPGSGRLGVSLAWDWPAEEEATYFEVYQSLRRDSLGSPVLLRDGADPSRVPSLRLPDSAGSGTLYYGVRGVRVEPTGQKVYGDTIPVDSLILSAAVAILNPAPLSRHAGRLLDVEVKTASDGGILLRQTLDARSGGAWARLLDTCLPMIACGTPIFGSSQQRDALTLGSLAAGDTLETLYCVHGDETFEDVSTGRRQALVCARFLRTGP